MSTLSGLSILVVDDDEDTREIMEIVLDGQGATVRSARSVADAWEAILAATPDVVLTDIALPDEDGFALVARLRANDATRAVPAIAVTGYTDPSSRERAIAAGFQKFITKPFDVLTLAAAIAGVVHSGHGVGELDDAAIAQLVVDRDVRAILAALNRTTPYRYTSVLRFVNEKLVSIWTFDRVTPGVDTFAPDLPVTASYCSLVRAAGAPHEIVDALSAEHLVDHPAREALRAYCGVPLVRADGSFFGTLCSYDEEPRPISSGAVGAMERVARLLVPALSAER